MLDRPDLLTGKLVAKRTSPLPVAGMITGMEAEAAAALLPRLFNLCRVAQSLAARMAFDLPLVAGQAEAIRQEVLREHLVKFCLKFPGHFGQGAQPLPEGWQEGADRAREVLFGSTRRLPETPESFARFVDNRRGVGSVLARVRDCFSPGEAAGAPLPSVTPQNALSAAALESSVAGRQAHRPIMQQIEREFGRGPFWRATARAYDAQDCMDGLLPKPVSPERGVAVVPAARGTYAISARVVDGVVTSFRRITPTDHLLAEGGILDQTLASLPTKKNGMAPLLMDIVDPCMPVQLKEVAHA